MTEKNHQRFDFRQIADADETALSFKAWITKASSYVSEFVEQLTDSPATLSVESIATASYGTVANQVSTQDLYGELTLASSFSSLLVASDKALRLIVYELLALPPSEQDLVTSSMELAVAERFLAMLCRLLQQGWLGYFELELQAAPLDRNLQKSKHFRSRDLVTTAKIVLEMKSGKANLHWILPRQELHDLLLRANLKDQEVEKHMPPPEMVQRIPLELVTVLGQATLPMSALPKISVGQVIPLNRRVDQPVTIAADGHPLYEGWPGRIGRTQAIQVAAVL